MSEDRTTPMRQVQWSQRPVEPDDQETVYANQETETPPTIPLGDQRGMGRSQPPGSGFAHMSPTEGVTPSTYQQPWMPFGPSKYPEPMAPQAQTMLISERPSPVFAWLIVVDGPARADIGVVHTLRPDTTAIGRVSGNHIVIHDETCSAQHARIRIEAKEGKQPAYVLYDMGSRNGTFVGDRESYKSEENRKYRHELQDGDYVLIGETTLVFKKL